jgi:two-component system cell cycle sensor histidine kinase/response regulator CckA
MVALALENEGFSVLTAGNGIEAMDLSRSHHGAIDLLVSDVKMPLMDGCTLAGRLQAESPELPVLLISGYCADEPEIRHLRFPLLPKPFSMKSLLRLVRDLLNQPVHTA